jgi:ubiquinone/menaquinone biosynthesis C-methylase UbiE
MATFRTQSGPPSPALIFETFNAYQRSGALQAAIQLDLFTAIAEGNQTVPDIAKRIGASEKGARVLCDYLTVIGFLTKDNSQYGLTPDSAFFLDRRAPAYMGATAVFLGELEDRIAAFKDIASAVRKGGTTMPGAGSMDPEHPMWVTFARSMAPMMAMPAELIAKMIGAPEGRPSRVLDIAAGHGLFGISIGRQNPNAHIVALDWAPVLEVAKENAAKAGIAERYSLLAGSAFDVDLGGDYDVALLTNFLHHFNKETCEVLLRRIHGAMKPGGVVATLEFIPNEDRVSPPVAATFSMMMLATTLDGDAYTFGQFDEMFRNAGFSRNELKEMTPLPERVVLSYK